MAEVDLEDTDGVADAVSSARPEWVFHLAAYGAYAHQSDLPRIVRTNIIGTVNVAEACTRSGFDAFVNAGSSSEYGLKDHPPEETEALEPNSHYAWTKAAATHYCRFTAASRCLEMTTLRLYSVFGPFEAPGRLMPTLVSRGLAGELPDLVDPAVGRDFVYVDDVCDAFVRAAERSSGEHGAIYNVGTGVQTTLGSLVELVKKRFGIEREPSWGSMPRRSWDTEVWVADNLKIAEELGWRPTHSLDEGFNLFVDWFADHPQLEQAYSRGVQPGRAPDGTLTVG
jgi:dolichol-phosphate mannosyltransferase